MAHQWGEAGRHRDRRRERLPAADRQDLLRAGFTRPQRLRLVPVGADDRFAKLSFAIKPTRDDGEYIPVREQPRHRLAADGQSTGWGQRWSCHLVAARAVPGAADGAPWRQGQAGAIWRPWPARAVVVIWSSAIGVRALVEGVPVQHFAPHWICEKWGDRTRWRLQRMAHAQWHFDEIASGEPFRA